MSCPKEPTKFGTVEVEGQRYAVVIKPDGHQSLRCTLAVSLLNLEKLTEMESATNRILLIPPGRGFAVVLSAL